MAVSRRLAAILAADVVGHSRLMGADDEGTHTALQAIRGDLVDPKITEYCGRIVNTTGDGLLAEFASVVDAVRCAAELQRAMVDRSAGAPPARRIEFRVGINVGDIIVEADDIYGDGVISPLASKRWPNRAASASRHGCRKTLPGGSTSASRIWASTASKISPARCGSTGL